MKVDGPNPLRSSASRRKAGGTAGDGTFAGLLGPAGEASDDAPAKAPARASAADALLALQEVPTPDEREARRRRGRERADAILDSLEALRRDLLLGQIPADRLAALAERVRAVREVVDDPRLDSVLDEVDLRARVELAKRGVPV